MKVLLTIKERLSSVSNHVTPETENCLPTSIQDRRSGYASALKWVVGLMETPVKEVFTEDQLVALQAALDNNKTAWQALHGKTRGTIVKKGLVILNGPYPVLTEQGEAVVTSRGLMRAADAMEVPENAVNEAEVRTFSKDQLMALQAALDHDQETWQNIHGRTRTSIAKQNLIVMFDTYPALTEAGEEVAAQHKLTKSERFIDIPEGIDSIVLVKRAYWTPKQIECFKVVATKDLPRWNAISSKTREAMINAGWVRVADGVPAYTDTGKTMAIMNGISVSSLKPEEA